MVIMESHHRIRELWTKIDNLHLKFLDLEESNEKIEARNELEEFIHEYLTLCPHEHKYTLHVVHDVLINSAMVKPDFSAYKASTGFNSIQLYASNLLSQPWRKEYRQIRRYSGFYMHQIESNLANSGVLFEAMGYRDIGNSTFLLDGPVEPDKVITVSKDCFIAYVECQIVKAIWEDFSQSNYPVTWLEILDFRKKHASSIEQTIKVLKYQSQYRNYLNFYVQQPTIPPAAFNYHLPPVNAQCCNHQMVAAPPAALVAGQMMRPQFSTNGYYYNSIVPTAQLVEYDSVDSPTITKNSDSQYEDWDYVYKTLENQGYTKDLGERGDVLNPNSTLSNDKVKMEKKLKRTTASPSSSYDNLPAPSCASVPKYKEETATISVTPKSISKKKDEKWQCVHCTYLNEKGKNICEMCGKSRTNLGADDDDGVEVGGAECEYCTLVNPKDAKKCQACHKDLKNSATRV